MTNHLARGTCPECGASVVLRKDGSIRIHQNRSATPSRINGARVYPHCGGTNQAPRDERHADTFIGEHMLDQGDDDA